MTAARPLPGIRIGVDATPLDEALPRMDIAVFVGFAATGPLHLPVVVASVAQFAAVFGADAPLAWNAATGMREHAQLGPAVRAFFSNGGQRCWVIRVARSRALADAAGGGKAVPVAASNRFELPGLLAVHGWDAPSVAPAQMLARCEGSWSDELRVSAALAAPAFALAGVARSGAPRIYGFRTDAALAPGDLIVLADPVAGRGRQVFAAVREVQPPAGASGRRITVELCGAFQNLAAAPVPPPPRVGRAQLAQRAHLVAANLGQTGGDVTLQIGSAAAAALAPGAWVRWTRALEMVWLRVASIRDGADEGAPGKAILRGRFWTVLHNHDALQLHECVSAAVLSLDLRVDALSGSSFRLSGVGLTPAHPRSWWTLLADAELYAPGAAAARAPDTTARFPLAADRSRPAIALLPLDVTGLFDAAAGPLPQKGDALERDGLSAFDAALFLDPALRSTRCGGLLDAASLLAFAGERPRPLLGLHAALALGEGVADDEATLIAVPDAVHAGWLHVKPAPPPPPKPSAPLPHPQWAGHRGPCAASSTPGPAAPDFSGFLDCATAAIKPPVLSGPHSAGTGAAFRLKWPNQPGAAFTLQQARRYDFSDALEIYRGAFPGASGYKIAGRAAGHYYYRVAAAIGEERGDYSNGVAVAVGSAQWRTRTPAQYAAGAGETQLLEIHRALLRLGAASGELFAALSLPRHYRAPEAVRYAQRLRALAAPSPADPTSLADDERRALSFGALHHPWLAYAGAGGPSLLPPDGAVLGQAAACARSRGAWVAPANRDIRDVIALAPPVARGDWQALQDAQVNLLRQEPRGFVALDADTLSNDAELRPINVRRLLILLRRLALKRGAAYVFEPNGDVLRRAVRRGFDELLGLLFARGAFAGATAAESYQVVTGGSLATASDYDNGRFLAELRVAPSVPMRFLSVLLRQAGERLTVSEAA